MIEEKYLTVKAVSEILGYHEMTVRRMIYDGKLASIKIGRKSVRIPQSEIARITSQGRIISLHDKHES